MFFFFILVLYLFIWYFSIIIFLVVLWKTYELNKLQKILLPFCLSLGMVKLHMGRSFFDIYTLSIIYRVKNLDIHKLSIRFRVFNGYPLSTIIY